MNTTTADARSDTATDQPQAGQLRRSRDDRMLAGVAGGIAERYRRHTALETRQPGWARSWYQKSLIPVRREPRTTSP